MVLFVKKNSTQQKTPHNKSPSHKYNSSWATGILKMMALGFSETSGDSHPEIQTNLERSKILRKVTAKTKISHTNSPFR